MFLLNSVFSCKVLRKYLVTNSLFVKKIFSVPCLHYKLMKLNFAICLVLSLSSLQQHFFGKTYGLLFQNVVMISNSFAFRKTKSCRKHALLVLRLTLVTNHQPLHETPRQNRLYYTEI